MRMTWGRKKILEAREADQSPEVSAAQIIYICIKSRCSKQMFLTSTKIRESNNVLLVKTTKMLNMGVSRFARISIAPAPSKMPQYSFGGKKKSDADPYYHALISQSR